MSNKPEAQLIGQNGNVFNIMAIASRSLKEVGKEKEAEEMRDRITSTAGSYDEALRIIMEYVEVC